MDSIPIIGALVAIVATLVNAVIARNRSRDERERLSEFMTSDAGRKIVDDRIVHVLNSRIGGMLLECARIHISNREIESLRDEIVDKLIDLMRSGAK